MSVNGHDPLQAAIEQAKQQRAAEQMLRQVLQQALNQPARVTRITGPSIVTVTKDGDDGATLIVAQVTGERWDIPLDVASSRRVAFALASTGTPDVIEGDDEGLAA